MLLSTWLQQIKIHITAEFVELYEWKCKIHTQQADVGRLGYCIAREAAIRNTSNEITVRSLALARKGGQLICCDKWGFSWGRYYEVPASSGRYDQLTLQWKPTRQQHTLLLWRNKHGFGCRSFWLAMKMRASYVSHLGSEGHRYKKYLTQRLYSSSISGNPEPPVAGTIYQIVPDSLNILLRREYKCMTIYKINKVLLDGLLKPPSIWHRLSLLQVITMKMFIRSFLNKLFK